MKLLITGSNGFLGRHLIYFLNEKKIEIIATNRGVVRGFLPESIAYIDVDLVDDEKLNCVIASTKPNIIIHTAAMSKPNECETNRELCISQNVSTVENLIKICKKNNIKLIFTSSDFVFGDGNNHRENDECYPLNFYGESKLKAEKIIINSGIEYCIVRPVFIYGKKIEGIRSGFIQWVEENLMTKKIIRVVDDQLRTATYVEDICFVVYQIILKNVNGIFNIAGEEILTPYSMAIRVAKYLKLDENLIIAVNENNFSEPVKRAKKCILNIDKAKQQLGFKPLLLNDGLSKCF